MRAPKLDERTTETCARDNKLVAENGERHLLRAILRFWPMANARSSTFGGAHYRDEAGSKGAVKRVSELRQLLRTSGAAVVNLG